ncbi:MAG: phospho-N-acetylmuramoyl-pentapeptide-transferase [Clostridia bacterium]
MNFNLILSAIVSFVIVAAFMPLLIPFLHKLKFGQSILEDGPTWHAKKQGTPTMGGLGIILGFAVSGLIFVHSLKGLAVMAAAVLFGVIGFVDDYIKVVKKHNQGFTPKQKFAAQIIVSLAFALYIYFVEGRSAALVPFAGIYLNLGIIYIPFVMFVLLATTNSVNLTDGLDGLAASVTTVAALFFAVACAKRGEMDCAAVMMAVVGACVGFLIYNFYPAKVFMGDTGSLFLGGALGCAAVSAGLELFLVIGGFVFLAETMSDIIQVAVFKRTGKRVFKMAPIHHHFEMCGWKEPKIVFVFSAVTALLCAAAYLGLPG